MTSAPTTPSTAGLATRGQTNPRHDYPQKVRSRSGLVTGLSQKARRTIKSLSRYLATRARNGCVSDHQLEVCVGGLHGCCSTCSLLGSPT